MQQPGVSEQDAPPSRAPFVSNAPKLGYFPPFDGLRGVAILMVLLAHLSYENFASFSASVDLFFVISGFLITTLILEEHRRTDDINLKQFYGRRVFRLFPMMYTTIALSVVGALVVGGKDLVRDTLNDAIAAAFYMYHVVHPVMIEITTSRFPVHRPMVQLWSLTVEEHFYLVAAIVTVLVVRYRKPRLLLVTFGAFWVVAAVARLTGHLGFRLFWMQRPDSLLVGVCVAYVHALMPTQLSERGRRLMLALGMLATATIAVVVFVGTGFAPYRIFVQFSPYDHHTPFTDRMFWARFGFSICNVCIGIMLLAAVRVPEWRLARMMSWKPLREVGIRSYCIYLIHVPLAVLLFAEFGTKDEHGNYEPNAPLFLAYVVLLVVLSMVSHKYLEQPAMRKGKAYMDRRAQAAAASSGAG